MIWSTRVWCRPTSSPISRRVRPSFCALAKALRLAWCVAAWSRSNFACASRTARRAFCPSASAMTGSLEAVPGSSLRQHHDRPPRSLALPECPARVLRRPAFKLGHRHEALAPRRISRSPGATFASKKSGPTPIAAAASGGVRAIRGIDTASFLATSSTPARFPPGPSHVSKTARPPDSTPRPGPRILGPWIYGKPLAPLLPLPPQNSAAPSLSLPVPDAAADHAHSHREGVLVSCRERAHLALGSEGAADSESALLSVSGAARDDGLGSVQGRGSPLTYPSPSTGSPPVKGAPAPDPEGVDWRRAGALLEGGRGVILREGSDERRQVKAHGTGPVRASPLLVGCSAKKTMSRKVRSVSDSRCRWGQRSKSLYFFLASPPCVTSNGNSNKHASSPPMSSASQACSVSLCSSVSVPGLRPLFLSACLASSLASSRGSGWGHLHAGKSRARHRFEQADARPACAAAFALHMRTRAHRTALASAAPSPQTIDQARCQVSDLQEAQHSLQVRQKDPFCGVSGIREPPGGGSDGDTAHFPGAKMVADLDDSATMARPHESG